MSASAPQTGLSQAEPVSRLGPSGFDPSRFVGCCYRCTDEECQRNPIQGIDWRMQRMFCCTNCGNKRCPHATDHRHMCTGSNVAGQAGSNYGHPTLDGDQLIELLDNLSREHGSLSAWAKSKGVHPELALLVARGARPPAATLLRALGLVRTVAYAPASAIENGGEQ